MCSSYICVKCKETKRDNCGGTSIFISFKHGEDVFYICDDCIHREFKKVDVSFSELIRKNIIDEEMIIKYYTYNLDDYYDFQSKLEMYHSKRYYDETDMGFKNIENSDDEQQLLKEYNKKVNFTYNQLFYILLSQYSDYECFEVVKTLCDAEEPHRDLFRFLSRKNWVKSMHYMYEKFNLRYSTLPSSEDRKGIDEYAAGLIKNE